MSSANLTTVNCNQCGNGQSFTTWESLNVTLHPKEKEELLAGNLNRFTCQKCSWSGEVIYSMLYHDMRRHLMVWLWPGEGEPDVEHLPFLNAMENYQFRIVSERNELIEKIHIFDAGLDDRMVEIVKAVVRKQAEASSPLRAGHILFANDSKEGSERHLDFIHLGEDEDYNFMIPFDSYQKCADLIASKPEGESPTGRWKRVGHDYALAQISKR